MDHRDKLIYLAGIIDGEGSIMLWMNKDPHKSGQFNLRINVTSTSKCLIDWIHQHFGGHTYLSNAPSRQANPHWKKQYLWSVSRPQILQFLKDIHPFLIVKKECCEIAIKFRETFSKRERRLSKETFDLRLNLFEQMKHLNTRGC